MTSKEHIRIKTLSITLVVVMVLSIMAPYGLVGVANATTNNTNSTAKYTTCGEQTIQNILLSSPGECSDEITDQYSTNDYNNIEDIYTYIYTNDFLSTESGADKTPWATVGDGSFRYVHTVTTQYLTEGDEEWSLVAPENDSKIEEVRFIHTWYKQVAGYEDGEIVQVHESKIEETYIKEDGLNDTDSQDNKVYGVTTVSTVNDGELPASEKEFADAVLKDLGTSLDEVKQNADNTQDSTKSRIDDFLSGEFTENSNTQGSLIDYSIDGEDRKVSIFMGRFKDSQTADELFELRSTPPIENTHGDINHFNRLTSEDGTAKISGDQNGLHVGLSAYQVPDSKIENGMTLVTQADKYPNDVNIQIVTRTGKVLDEGPITKSMSLNSNAIEYANSNNALFVVLDSDNYSETMDISYMSIVTNTDSAESHTEGTTITSSLQLGQDDAETIEDTQDDTNVPDSTNKEIAGAILNYDINTNTFSESVQYAGGYSDGDGPGLEYLERKYPTIMELNGDISNYPHLVDEKSDTSATLTGNSNGLEVMMGSDNVPLGRNHAVVMDYKVTSGSAPTVYLSTLSGHRLEIDPSNLKTNEQDTLVIDSTKLSEYINNNGVLFVTIDGQSNAQMEVSCLSVIANVENPDGLTCNGSTENGGKSADTTGELNQGNFEPNAKFDASPTNLKTGQETILSASDSFDQDGQIAEYKWEMNGQTKYGSQLSHSFSEAGTYEITLTVTDNSGATDTTSKTVSVTKDYVDKYTYEYEVINTEYTTAEESPGSEWEQGEVVNRDEYTVVVDTVEQATSPGSEWRQGDFSHTETRVVDTHYTTSTSSPGSEWEKVKKVGTVTKTNTEYTTTSFGESPSGSGWTHYDSSDCDTSNFFGETITMCSTWHWKKTTTYTVDEYQWKKEITEEVDIYEWEKTEQRVDKTYSWSKEVTETKSGVTYGQYPTEDNLIESSVEKTSISCETLSVDKQNDLEACYPDN